MPVFLRMIADGQFRDVAIIDPSQSLVIGRSSAADCSFPTDSQMSSRHAQISVVKGEYEIRDLQSTNGTFVNEAPIEVAVVQLGDVIRCGTMEFVLDESNQPRLLVRPPAKGPKVSDTVQGKGKKGVAGTDSAAAAALPPEILLSSGFLPLKAAEVLTRFELAPQVGIAPAADDDIIAFGNRLLDETKENQLLDFIAGALPKRCGVFWAIECVQSVPALRDPGDEQVLAAALAWVKNPTDELRRAAMDAAQKLDLQTAASWTGVAAFWSCGSMSPAGQPAVPAGDPLAGRAISGATVLASVFGNPAQAPARRKAFWAIAQEIAAGERKWDAAKTMVAAK